MDAVELAAALCRRFEGFFSHPYLCPAGVPTIGYGATYYEDGRKVTLRDPPITESGPRNCCRTRSAAGSCRPWPGCAPVPTVTDEWPR
jgi:GH24 family phage-related lysozyme (muramidase)